MAPSSSTMQPCPLSLKRILRHGPFVLEMVQQYYCLLFCIAKVTLAAQYLTILHYNTTTTTLFTPNRPGTWNFSVVEIWDQLQDICFYTTGAGTVRHEGWAR